MKAHIIFLAGRLCGNIKILMYACLWLFALLFAIYPEIMMQPIYDIVKIKESIGNIDNYNMTTSRPFIYEWSELYIARKSFYFIPLAVFVDALLIWLLIKESQAGQWLPVRLLTKSQPPFITLSVVIISTLGLVIGGYMGMDALEIMQKSQEASKDTVNNTNFHPAAIMSLCLVLFFSVVAKYCSLIIVDVSPSGSSILPVNVDQYLNR